MADNLTGTVATTPDTVVTVGTGCSTVTISNPSTNSYPVMVLIAGLHDDGNYVPVFPGTSEKFRYYDNRIKTINMHGNGGSVTGVGYGVIAKTPKGT